MSDRPVLPRYRSHKIVEAVKITRVDAFADGCQIGWSGGEMFVSGDYFTKHNPQVGGYFVLYEDGYKSWSPADAFEAGYLPVRSAPVMESPEPMMQFFVYAHLPAHLQEISRNFCELAEWVCEMLPRNPERTVTLRKILEAKDCAVRSFLYK